MHGHRLIHFLQLYGYKLVFYYNLFFLMREIALQSFVVFCHTSTRISYRYTHVPSLSNLSPISLPIPPF